MAASSGQEPGLRVGFKRHLRAHVVRGEAVYLLSERGATSVAGAHVEALAPLLDGTRDLTELCRDLPADLPMAEAGSTVMRLVEAGLVVLREPAEAVLEHEAGRPSLAYWESAGLDPASAVNSVRGARVQATTVGDVDAGPAVAALRAAGLSVETAPADSLGRGVDLSVVICEDYLDDALERVNALHRAAGCPWLLAKPGGTQVWIGPVFQPPSRHAGESVEATACWQCLAHRLRGHRQAETHLRALPGQLLELSRPAVSLPPLGAAATNLIALEAVKWIAGLRNDGQRMVWTLDSFDLQGRRHELRPRPQCPACGDPGLMSRQARRPVVLGHRAKSSRSGGGHRSMPPEEVLRTYEHLISPVTGVLNEITRDERGPDFFNSFRAGPNLALNVRRRFDHMRSARAENGGKGVTPLHGKVSALCEAIERHSGYFHGDEERIVASYSSLGDEAGHPGACLLFHERQYEGRAEWNATHSSFQYVCEPFDDDAVTSWTPVWSLTERRHRLLPTGLLYFDVPGETGGGGSLSADSNGNAAGSSLEDALLQGLLELVERDAVALWWYNRTRAPGVDLDSFGVPWIDRLQEVYAVLHRDVWVLDVSSDVGIPTMAALSRRTDGPREDVMFGFGAHLDPQVALVRALTEMNQLMPAVVGAGEGGDYDWSDPDAVHWWRTATWGGLPYLRPDPAVRSRTPADYPYSPADDLHADIITVQQRLESLGLDVMVLDQTRPDVGLPVVKAIVPGLRGFWARLAPGRLYDVPVKLGRLALPTAYDDLNPIPLFV
ncbi:MAG TPA: TOMM precursor leader peptide-binding protein [Actinophytocola sp.]|jgi:ribosomal protein S12 methylthiotransferase accessory factor|nr:TOMM precursor leader peptide-binding protein [Actinophytocola sp.]